MTQGTLDESDVDMPAQSSPSAAADTLRQVYEAERKNYWDAANLLSRGMAFYLAISGAVLAYALTRELPAPLPKQIAWAGLVISLTYMVALAMGILGLLQQLELVHKLQAALFTELPNDIVPESLLDGRRRVVIVLAACTYVLISVVTYGLLTLLIRL